MSQAVTRTTCVFHQRFPCSELLGEATRGLADLRVATDRPSRFPCTHDASPRACPGLTRTPSVGRYAVGGEPGNPDGFPGLAFVYFASFFFLSNYILLNLFVAVILDNFATCATRAVCARGWGGEAPRVLASALNHAWRRAYHGNAMTMPRNLLSQLNCIKAIRSSSSVLLCL